ncbi:hypothetical protein E2C01_051068 [Portunus trituberculatus]|uniref:Uncharacterized protein n=1 Tax=Portunus trituberculatus TaxID=210409 RepID=A0A5B7GI63_PORTR|nr:hypothetical protein [Portunus trituberculatus]
MSCEGNARKGKGNDIQNTGKKERSSTFLSTGVNSQNNSDNNTQTAAYTLPLRDTPEDMNLSLLQNSHQILYLRSNLR